MALLRKRSGGCPVRDSVRLDANGNHTPEDRTARRGIPGTASGHQSGVAERQIGSQPQRWCSVEDRESLGVPAPL